MEGRASKGGTGAAQISAVGWRQVPGTAQLWLRRAAESACGSFTPETRRREARGTQGWCSRIDVRLVGMCAEKWQSVSGKLRIFSEQDRW